MPKVNQQLHNSNEYDISQSDQADYLDILEGDVNCPACLLQVNRLLWQQKVTSDFKQQEFSSL